MWRGLLCIPFVVGCADVRVVDDDGEQTGGSVAVTTPTSGTGGFLPTGGTNPSGAGASGGGAPVACTPGEVQGCYEGAPETIDVGICTAGARECLSDGSDFGPCLGQIVPAAIDDCVTAADDDCDGFAIATCDGFLPMPPDASNFGWQTLQERFVKDGAPCRAEVTLGVGDSAVCYAGADDHMYCAGVVVGEDYGPGFTDTGLEGPLQILLGSQWDDATPQGSQICAALRDGTLMCRSPNHLGQLGLGHNALVGSFTAWGGRSDIVRAATGTSEEICVLTSSGDVYCAGLGFGSTPVLVGNGSKVWVDMDGAPHLDESPVLRVSQRMSACAIDPVGFDCEAFTVPFLEDDIVDGGWGAPGAAYLRADGTVGSTTLVLGGKEQSSLFEQGSVLALGLNGSWTRCAAFSDGSLRCTGYNSHGELGFDDVGPGLFVEIQVAPPGTLRTACN